MVDKILLIGGAGYVGTAIASYFLQKDFEVRVLDNFIYSHSFSVSNLKEFSNFKLYEAEMNDHVALERAASDVEHVVILSGLVGDPITKKYPNTAKIVNEVKIKDCIDFFDKKKISRLIFISTCSNYGLIPENHLADEEYELNPLSSYAKAKVAAESYLLQKEGKVSYDATILRFATAFGLSARMRFDLTVSEFVKDLYLGRELLVFDEHTWRPYCHVDDFARLIKKVISAEDRDISFEVFNAGGEENNFTKRMIADCILEKLPQGNVRFGMTGTDPRNYRVSFEKVRRILNFRPRYSVEHGITELLTALEGGDFSDVLQEPQRYGNFVIDDAN